MRFRAIIQLNGKTATGIHVPAEVVASRGPSERPAVRSTINGHTYRSTVAPPGGVFMLGVSAANRASAGDEVEVDLDLDAARRTRRGRRCAGRSGRAAAPAPPTNGRSASHGRGRSGGCSRDGWPARRPDTAGAGASPPAGPLSISGATERLFSVTQKRGVGVRDRLRQTDARLSPTGRDTHPRRSRQSDRRDERSE
jgi:hypothetical protein